MLINPVDDYIANSSLCSYYDPQTFSKRYSKDTNPLNLFHLNIRSLNKNVDLLLLFLDSLKVDFHVIVLSETWLNDPSEMLPVDGYKSYHSVRTDRKGGGVSVLVRDTIQSQLLPQFTLNNYKLEMCAVSLQIDSTVYNVLGVYRPPGNSIADFNTDFFHLISDDWLSNHFTAILGDFNIDMSDPNPPESIDSFISEFNMLHFLPTISVPTRICNNSSTLIDHIWINSLASYWAGVFPIHLFDHHPIFICLSHLLKKNSKDLIKTKFRCHSVANLAKFDRCVADLVEEFDYDGSADIERLTENFHDMLFSAYNTCCPVKHKVISLKRSRSPWLTPALLASIDRKQELYRLSKADDRYIPLFKQFRNVLTSVIRRAKAKITMISSTPVLAILKKLGK